MKTLVILMLLTACGPSLAQIKENDPCYEQAEAEAEVRVKAECNGSLSQCTVAGDILSELQRKYEACP